jgi:hypothetical protein
MDFTPSSPRSQGLDRGLLGEDRGAEHRVLVDLHHRVDELRRPAGVADPEPGHRERLREAVEEDRALLHAGEDRDARVGAVVDELRVDLVAEDDQVLLDREPGDLLQARPVAGAARRVARQVDHEDLAPRLPGLLQVRGVERKAVVGAGRHRDRDPVGARATLGW